MIKLIVNEFNSHTTTNLFTENSKDDEFLHSKGHLDLSAKKIYQTISSLCCSIGFVVYPKKRSKILPIWGRFYNIKKNVSGIALDAISKN